MTISTTGAVSGPYVTNGATINFAYDFKILEDGDLVVYKTTIATEADVTLTLDVDYTVTGAGGESGGNVVIDPALASGYRITVERAVPSTQETDFNNQGGFYADTHEDAFDKLTMIVQQIEAVPAGAASHASSRCGLNSRNNGITC